MGGLLVPAAGGGQVRWARHTAELHGTIYQTDEAETGRLLLREPLLTSLAPGDPGTAAAVEPAGSVWGGLSGALVFHAGRAVGVIVEHHPDYLTAADDGQTGRPRPVPDRAWNDALHHADPDDAHAARQPVGATGWRAGPRG